MLKQASSISSKDRGIDLYAKEIGKICNSDGAHTAQIADILRLSEEHKTLYHGINSVDAIEGIMRTGIEPRTQRSTPVSYWTDGIQLFIISDTLPITPLHTYQSAFFHYAHANTNPDMCTMQLAISDAVTLKNNGIDVETTERDVEGWIKLPFTVRFDMMSLLVLTLKHPAADSEHVTLRKYAELAENLMIEMLFEHLSNYSVGKILRKEVELR